MFGNELAGIPSQGWIRPSVAPKRLPRVCLAGLLDVLGPCHPVLIYPEGTVDGVTFPRACTSCPNFLQYPPPVSPVDFE